MFSKSSFSFFFIIIFLNECMYFWLSVFFGLCCCTGFFSRCGEQRLLSAAVCGLLIAVASFVAEHGGWGKRASGVEVHGLRSCSSRASEHRLSNCGTRA